jgi:hypothetical protein
VHARMRHGSTRESQPCAGIAQARAPAGVATGRLKPTEQRLGPSAFGVASRMLLPSTTSATAQRAQTNFTNYDATQNQNVRTGILLGVVPEAVTWRGAAL